MRTNATKRLTELLARGPNLNPDFHDTLSTRPCVVRGVNRPWPAWVQAPPALASHDERR
jgi:hypothetical protein